MALGPLELTPARLRTLLAGIAKPAGEHACWIWTGPTSAHGGYATFLRIPVYRVVYEWLVGSIPDGCELDHLCRNRACVNPHHLEPVTHAENQRRIKEYGPWQFRPYCRRGHALTGGNAREWSRNGSGEREVRCYTCHDGERETA